MLEKSLLERVRMVNRIILHCARQGPDINYAAGILAHVFSGSVFLVDETGRLLSDLSGQEMACTQLKEYLAAKRALPAYYHLSALLGDGGPRVNESYRLSACPLSGKEKTPCPYGDIYILLFPLYGGVEQPASLLVRRHEKPFTDDDLLLAEIGAAVAAMILMRLAKAKLEEEKWYRTMAGVAFESLSFSEVEAIEEIFKKLTENENIVVASKIADDLGITRSVIVNALRKFESAGIIESRSLGMKGTYIQLKNPCVLEEIAGRSAKLKAAFERQ